MPIVKCLILLMVTLYNIGCVKHSYHFINGAKLISNEVIEANNIISKRDSDINLLLSGHYLEKGDNLVIIIRTFDKGDLFSVDDEGYEKLSIEISKRDFEEPINLDSPNVKVYYSTGSSSSIRRAHGLYANKASGSISLSQLKGNKIRAALKLTTIAKPAGPFPTREKKVSLNTNYILEEININDLTPWLGKPSAKLGDEVYP